MISDAYVDVTCDNCYRSERIELEWKYRNWGEDSGFYDADDSSIEKTLKKEDGDWICEDEQHFCQEACKVQNDKEG